MALTVETGAVVANANSYVSLAAADAYHALYGNTDWAGADADKELALIQACQSLDLLYGSRFASWMLPNSTQSLLFPRYSFYDRNQRLRTQGTIPQELKNAQCEIALKSLLGSDILPDPSSQQAVTDEELTVDVITIKTSYKNNDNPSQVDGFRKVELILYPILVGDVQAVRFSL